MDIIKQDGNYLPSKLNELAEFVLVGRDKLNMVRAGIKALDKLDVAEEVRKQKQEEAQTLAEALLDAEVRIGEILLEMPKSGGGRPSEKTIDTGVDSFKPKMEAAKELGFDQKQVERFQILAKNKDLVEQVKQEAREEDDLPTRTAVLKAAKERRAVEKKESIVQERETELENEVYIEPEASYDVQPGQVWRLGRHTLICGDYYATGHVDADALVTDPPYGIDYDPDWKKWSGEASEFKKIHGDAGEFDPRPFLIYDTVVLFGANYYTRHLPSGGWICWDKRTKDELDLMIGSPFELAWFRSTTTSRSAIMVRVLHGGVVNADSEYGNNEKRYHPTQKPIKVFEKIIEQVTDQEAVVLDPFCGSGTSLLACELTRRTCIAFEIEPEYCNIILSRFKHLTKQEPWLESNA